MQQYIGITRDAIEMIGFFYDLAHIHGSSTTRDLKGIGVVRLESMHALPIAGATEPSNTHATKVGSQINQRLKDRASLTVCRRAVRWPPKCLALHTARAEYFDNSLISNEGLLSP